MRKPPGIPSLLALACFTAWLIGCFTEVGNAEDEKLLEAKFEIDYNRDALPLPKAAAETVATVHIHAFHLVLREAEYRVYDSARGTTVEKHLWQGDSAGILVDFTGGGNTPALPNQMVPAGAPGVLELKCLIPARKSLNPDTLDFDRFAGLGYIKGIHSAGGKVRKFLFALPAAREMHLNYSREALAAFRQGGDYRCRFTFFATKWVSAQPIQEARTWMDRSGNPVALFDGEHNATTYQALVTAFDKSFNTTKVGIIP